MRPLGRSPEDGEPPSPVAHNADTDLRLTVLAVVFEERFVDVLPVPPVEQDRHERPRMIVQCAVFVARVQVMQVDGNAGASAAGSTASTTDPARPDTTR